MTATESDDPGELGHRLCVLGNGINLGAPDSEPEAEQWLRRALSARPDDAVTATLLAGLLLRQLRTTLEMSPLYDGYGAPGTDRGTWLRALARRRGEAFHWYRHALAVDPGSAAAACGLALAALDEGWTDDFVYYERGDGGEPEGLDDDDPAARAEAAGHLRRVLAAEPDNTVAAHLLARLA